jgi:hypothetical protein
MAVTGKPLTNGLKLDKSRAMGSESTKIDYESFSDRIRKSLKINNIDMLQKKPGNSVAIAVFFTPLPKQKIFEN